MSKEKLLKQALALGIVAAIAAACSTPKQPVLPPEPESAPAPAPVASAPVEASAPVAMNHNAVYFAFDKYDVRPDYSGLIDANSKYISSSSMTKVQVQGNTDDIGSVEYNLALGQRRADAVKKALIAGGASSKQIEATSNGKLKPKYANDTAQSRAQNRRSDIMYQAEQPKGYSQDSNGLPMVDGTFYAGTVTEGIE